MTTYSHLVEQVTLLGNPHTARGLTTRELIGAGLVHPAGHLACRRDLNKSLGYMELCQLIAGTFNTAALARVAPRADLRLFTEQAAYGPRVLYDTDYYYTDQLLDVLTELKEDTGSRRAIIYMATPNEEFPSRPCTNSLQFLIRDGLVHLVVSMRSWDLYLGAPYDLTMFGGLVLVVARCLDLLPGNVTVSTGSAHIYVERLHYRSGWAKPSRTRFTFWPELCTLEGFREWAGAAVDDLTWTRGAPLGITEVDL